MSERKFQFRVAVAFIVAFFSFIGLVIYEKEPATTDAFTIVFSQVTEIGRVVEFELPSGTSCVHVQSSPSSPADIHCR